MGSAPYSSSQSVPEHFSQNLAQGFDSKVSVKMAIKTSGCHRKEEHSNPVDILAM